MEFKISIHCSEQLANRGIPEEIVAEVLNNPDKIIEEENQQKIYQKIINTYLFRVFVNNTKNPPLIKTVYKTSKISKY